MEGRGGKRFRPLEEWCGVLRPCSIILRRRVSLTDLNKKYHHHHHQQQQPSSCPSQECTHPPWPNEAPSLMHAGRKMRVPPPSTGQTEYDADKAKKTREPNHQLVGLSARWLVCLSTCRPKEAPSLMHARRRMRIPPPSTGQMEYDADKADKTREPNHLLVGTSACWFG